MEKSEKNVQVQLFVHEENGTGKIRKEYEANQLLFSIQPDSVQRFLEGQASLITEQFLREQIPIHFSLPERVITKPFQADEVQIPVEQRNQVIGGFVNKIRHNDARFVLSEGLARLEQSSNQATAVGAMLVRYAIAIHLVHKMLPAGRSIRYKNADDEEIPTIPQDDQNESEIGLQKLINGNGKEVREEHSELQMTFLPPARKFFLPKWVAFGSQGELLVNSITVAEACLESMRHYIWILNIAVGLAPYIVVDDVFQQKRYGMLGQLINQGRAFAAYQCKEIIKKIHTRAKASGLNRGLWVSVPYFDDHDLVIKAYRFEVIPVGWILFIPAFVVRAAQMESAKIAQDIHLSSSTRKHLLGELRVLGQEFVEN